MFSVQAVHGHSSILLLLPLCWSHGATEATAFFEGNADVEPALFWQLFDEYDCWTFQCQQLPSRADDMPAVVLLDREWRCCTCLRVKILLDGLKAFVLLLPFIQRHVAPCAVLVSM